MFHTKTSKKQPLKERPRSHSKNNPRELLKDLSNFQQHRVSPHIFSSEPACSEINLDDKEDKAEWDRKRKAKNQRAYYEKYNYLFCYHCGSEFPHTISSHRHKATEQAKARQ